MNWVQLTNPNDGTPIWINLDTVHKMYMYMNNAATVLLSVQGETTYVKELPNAIIAMQPMSTPVPAPPAASAVEPVISI